MLRLEHVERNGRNADSFKRIKISVPEKRFSEFICAGRKVAYPLVRPASSRSAKAVCVRQTTDVLAGVAGVPLMSDTRYPARLWVFSLKVAEIKGLIQAKVKRIKWKARSSSSLSSASKGFGMPCSKLLMARVSK